MPFDLNSLMHDGPLLSVFGVLLAFIAFYAARWAIQFIYKVWPFGKIKALRKATRIRDERNVASPESHVCARKQLVCRLNEGTDALAKQIIQAKLFGVSASVANVAQGIIGVIMLMAYVRSNVPAEAVGVWSTVILGATLFKLVLNLDTVAEKAKKDADKLDALIRYGQDKLAALDARSTRGEDRTDALLVLLDEITARLTAIVNPGADVPKPPESPPPSLAAGRPPAALAPTEKPFNPGIKHEDPRLILKVGALKKEGGGFQNAIGVIVTNVGGSEIHKLRLDEVILTQKTIEFPENIPALEPGASTHPIAGRVTGFGPLQMFDIAAALLAEWDHQPKALVEIIPCPGSATYEDFKGNRFKATWTWEFYPFKYRQWVSRVEKRTDEWLPDTVGPYLIASAVHTERLPHAAKGTEKDNNPLQYSLH